MLVNGEPEDVIPDILLHEKVEENDEEGNIRLVDKEAEHISCNYRLPQKKAKKEELPRLVSAMIGCSYGELINRRKIYAIRQLTAIMALLLFFSTLISASLLRNAKLIRQSYINALHDQAVQLSEAASELLENGDQVDAILLALKALPSEKNSDMPVTSDAVKALIDTTYAYKTPNPDTFSVMWNYSMVDYLLYMVLSDDESMLAATDTHGNVKVWNTATHKVLLDTRGNKFVSVPIFLPNNRILLLDDFEAIIYDIETGSVLFSILPDTEFVLETSIYINDEKSFFILCQNGQLCEYSLEDGSLLDSCEINTSDEYISNYKFTENGKMIAYTATNSSLETSVKIYDTVAKETSLVFSSDRDVLKLLWIDNNILMFSELEPFETRNLFYSSEEYRIDDNSVDIHCYDAKKKSEVWKNTLSYNYPMLNEGFLRPADTNAVSYYIGNSLVIYNLKNGSEINYCDFGASISDVCDAENGTLYCYTENGGFANVSAQEREDSNTIKFLFPQNVQEITRAKKGIYMTHSNKTSIIYYENCAHDDSITFFSQGPDIKNSGSNYLDDNVLITIYDDTDCPKLCAYDLNDYETITVIDLLDEQTEESMDIIGLYNGIVYAACSDFDTSATYDTIIYSVSAETMYEINYQTGEIKPAELPEVSEENLSLHTSVILGNELVYPVINSEDETAKIMILNLDTKDIREFSCPYSIVDSLVNLCYDKESQMIFCSGREDCVIDLENNQYHIVEYPENWDFTLIVSSIKKGKVYTASPDTVVAIDKSGAIIQEFCQPGYMPQGLCPIETENDTSELLVLYDQFIIRYDTQTGKELSEFNASIIYMGRPQVYYDRKSKNLILSNYSHSLIIDTEDWKELANISNSYGYDKNNDRFLVFYPKDDGYGSVGYFNRYTTNELIQKAHDITGDEQLSEENKVNYSIED